MARLPILLMCTSLMLLACGQQAPEQALPPTDDLQLTELRARVGQATGQWQGDVTAAGPYSAGQQEPQQQPSAGFRTVPIQIKGFSIPAGQMQVPAHWKDLPDGAGYTAPGVSVKNLKAVNFTYATGQLAQFYQQSGSPMRTPVPPEQVVQLDLVPRMRQEGLALTGQQELPALGRLGQQLLDNINVSNGQVRNSSRTNLSEWSNGDARVALLMTWMCFQGATTNWSYTITRLETTADRYEREKNAWLQGAANVQYNPAFFAAFRQREQQKQAQWQQNENQRTQQSWAAHNQRIQANQAAFNAQQAAHNDMVNSVNNSIMGGYNSTMNSMDNMQNSTINGIRGEQDATNPYTGEAGKIQSGYNNYWMNSDGQYIGTDNGTYDPNVDGQWTDQWREVPTQP